MKRTVINIITLLVAAATLAVFLPSVIDPDNGVYAGGFFAFSTSAFVLLVEWGLNMTLMYMFCNADKTVIETVLNVLFLFLMAAVITAAIIAELAIIDITRSGIVLFEILIYSTIIVCGAKSVVSMIIRIERG